MAKIDLKKFNFIYIESGETHSQIIWAWVIDHAQGVFELKHPNAMILGIMEG